MSADAIRETAAEIGERSMRQALAPFGWTCTEDFWRRYYSDPWVFNLANAVERLTAENARLLSEIRSAIPTMNIGE